MKRYIYGDELQFNRESYDGSLLCLSLNLNGIQHENWKAKNNKLKTFLKNYNFDIMGFQEVNINWDKVQSKDIWEERTMGWWKEGSTCTKAYNTQDILSSTHQPGGCMVTSVNNVKRKVVSCGIDKRGLGRWIWTRYKA